MEHRGPHGRRPCVRPHCPLVRTCRPLRRADVGRRCCCIVGVRAGRRTDSRCRAARLLDAGRGSRLRWPTRSASASAACAWSLCRQRDLGGRPAGPAPCSSPSTRRRRTRRSWTSPARSRQSSAARRGRCASGSATARQPFAPSTRSTYWPDAGSPPLPESSRSAAATRGTARTVLAATRAAGMDVRWAQARAATRGRCCNGVRPTAALVGRTHGHHPRRGDGTAIMWGQPSYRARARASTESE